MSHEYDFAGPRDSSAFASSSREALAATPLALSSAVARLAESQPTGIAVAIPTPALIPCGKIPCPYGQTCGSDGICRVLSPLPATTNDPCGGVVCPHGLTCRGGACLDLTCEGVACPSGQFCVGGACGPMTGTITMSRDDFARPARPVSPRAFPGLSPALTSGQPTATQRPPPSFVPTSGGGGGGGFGKRGGSMEEAPGWECPEGYELVEDPNEPEPYCQSKEAAPSKGGAGGVIALAVLAKFLLF